MPSQRIDSAGAKGPSPPLRRIWLHRATLLILATALGLGAGWLGLAGPWREPAPAHSPLPGVLWPNPRPIGAFTLQDHHGQAFTREHLDGAWTFMFFGYTHCPDICPTTLATLRRVEHDLAEHVSAPRQHVLVSVDPARDTVEHLAGYVSSFGPAFLGVTGNDGELSKLAREVGAVFFRGEPEPDDSYFVDHTASIMLIDPRERLGLNAETRGDDVLRRGEVDPAGLGHFGRRLRDQIAGEARDRRMQGEPLDLVHLLAEPAAHAREHPKAGIHRLAQHAAHHLVVESEQHARRERFGTDRMAPLGSMNITACANVSFGWTISMIFSPPLGELRKSLSWPVRRWKNCRAGCPWSNSLSPSSSRITRVLSITIRSCRESSAVNRSILRSSSAISLPGLSIDSVPMQAVYMLMDPDSLSPLRSQDLHGGTRGTDIVERVPFPEQIVRQATLRPVMASRRPSSSPSSFAMRSRNRPISA